MKLVIQGLAPEEWEKIKDSYADCTVIEDQNTIHPCTGCFSCWNRTPGKCVIPDGYENMGREIHHADEVIVLSRYVYGGFSGFVKNVFDRSLGYVLPQLQVVRGETHHQKRYPEEKAFSFIFYGNSLSEEEKLRAKNYVRAVCRNIRGYVKKVEFRESGGFVREKETTELPEKEKVMFLNASVRFEKGNSAKLTGELVKGMHKEAEIVPLMKYMETPEVLLERLQSVSDLVLSLPLYVDGLPSQLIRFMELAERDYAGFGKRVYVLANMGLYETSQLESLFSAIRQWCSHMGFQYCGGLGVSAGELIGGVMDLAPFGIGPTKTTAEGIEKLRAAIDAGAVTEDIFVEPWKFPRSLYLFIANTSWDSAAWKNGMKPKDLYRKL